MCIRQNKVWVLFVISLQTAVSPFLSPSILHQTLGEQVIAE